MKIFLFLFVALVILIMIAGSIYISLPSKVLGDLEERFQKKAELPDDKTNSP